MDRRSGIVWFITDPCSICCYRLDWSGCKHPSTKEDSLITPTLSISPFPKKKKKGLEKP